jgi:hypothetical protein
MAQLLNRYRLDVVPEHQGVQILDLKNPTDPLKMVRPEGFNRGRLAPRSLLLLESFV